jgi:hypothetical protein
MAECAGIEGIIAMEARPIPCTRGDAREIVRALSHLPHHQSRKTLLDYDRRSRQIAERELAKHWLAVRVVAQRLDRVAGVARSELLDIFANPRPHFSYFRSREAERLDRATYHLTGGEIAIATRVLEDDYRKSHGEEPPWNRRKATMQRTRPRKTRRQMADELTRKLGRRPAGMQPDGTFVSTRGTIGG